MEITFLKLTIILKYLYRKETVRFLFMVLTWFIFRYAFSNLDPTDKYLMGGFPDSYYCMLHSIEHNTINIMISFLFIIIISTLFYYGGYKMLVIYFLCSTYKPFSLLFKLSHPYYLPLACKLFFVFAILPFVLLVVFLLILKKTGKLTSTSRALAFILVFFICCFSSYFFDMKRKITAITSRIRAEERAVFYKKNAVPVSVRVHYENLHKTTVQRMGY